MGFADFNCTNGDLCQIAHTAADTGGEFAAAMSLNISWHPQVRMRTDLEKICIISKTIYYVSLFLDRHLYFLIGEMVDSHKRFGKHLLHVEHRSTRIMDQRVRCNFLRRYQAVYVSSRAHSLCYLLTLVNHMINYRVA